MSLLLPPPPQADKSISKTGRYFFTVAQSLYHLSYSRCILRKYIKRATRYIEQDVNKDPESPCVF